MRWKCAHCDAQLSMTIDWNGLAQMPVRCGACEGVSLLTRKSKIAPHSVESPSPSYSAGPEGTEFQINIPLSATREEQKEKQAIANLENLVNKQEVPQVHSSAVIALATEIERAHQAIDVITTGNQSTVQEEITATPPPFKNELKRQHTQKKVPEFLIQNDRSEKTTKRKSASNYLLLAAGAIALLSALFLVWKLTQPVKRVYQFSQENRPSQLTRVPPVSMASAAPAN